mgnify:CR=1 FL=1
MSNKGQIQMWNWQGQPFFFMSNSWYKEKNTEINFEVENCEKTKFNSDQFDFIYGAGILHHLNIKESLNEIKRLLKR